MSSKAIDLLKQLASGKISPTVLVNLGRQAWKVVEANRPVANVNLQSASIVPQGVNEWQALEGWQAPRSRVFRTSYKNAYGMTVVQFDYRLTYTYGGSIAGTGRYLAQVSVAPADISVAWGYTLNAEAKVPVITNAGTHQSPIAAAQVEVNWKVDTVLRSIQKGQAFYVRADGQMIDLSAGTP
jgi:hypothetical protein